MENYIYTYGVKKRIKPEDYVNTFRALTAFCNINLLYNNVFKTQGGYYRIVNGKLRKVAISLNTLTFSELYKLCG